MCHFTGNKRQRAGNLCPKRFEVLVSQGFSKDAVNLNNHIKRSLKPALPEKCVFSGQPQKGVFRKERMARDCTDTIFRSESQLPGKCVRSALLRLQFFRNEAINLALKYSEDDIVLHAA